MTLTDQGTRISNLLLDGIWDENILTQPMVQTMRPALAGTAVRSELLFDKGAFRGGPRPQGGNGRLSDAQIHTGLNGFWPQTPDGVQWIAANASGQESWIFAASSLDPAEADPADTYNGTAFTDGGHAAAVLPFSPPAGNVPFTLAAEVALPLGLPGAAYIGFSSSSTTLHNF